MSRPILAASCAAVLLAAGCASSATSNGSSTGSGTMHSSMNSSMPGMTPSSTNSGSTSRSDGAMSGGAMGGMPMSGAGLQATVDGYHLAFPAKTMAGMAMTMTFTITKDGKPVTQFDREQTKLMHFYLIRSDLTGFQHLHPTLATDGTWSVTPSEGLTPGRYRIYTQFVPHGTGSALVTSVPLTVPGTPPAATPLPATATSTTVDGYTVKVEGALRHGTESPLTITISKGGAKVTDLQPYLGVFAHVTAIHAGDLGFAHLHPDTGASSATGGPMLTVHADLPSPGDYRAFIQFQTAGTLHTAAITLVAS